MQFAGRGPRPQRRLAKGQPSIVSRIGWRRNRTESINARKRFYRRYNLVEGNFGKPEDRRRISTRCNLLPEVFFGAICNAFILLF